MNSYGTQLVDILFKYSFLVCTTHSSKLLCTARNAKLHFHYWVINVMQSNHCTKPSFTLIDFILKHSNVFINGITKSMTPEVHFLCSICIAMQNRIKLLLMVYNSKKAYNTKKHSLLIIHAQNTVYVILNTYYYHFLGGERKSDYFMSLEINFIMETLRVNILHTFQ
jgi:hypothetical protein